MRTTFSMNYTMMTCNMMGSAMGMCCGMDCCVKWNNRECALDASV